MKRNIGLVIIAMFCLISVVFAGGVQTYKSPFFNFTVSYPQDWKTKEISGIVAFLSPLEAPDDRFSENVNIIVEDISAYQMNSEQYAKAGNDNWLKVDTKLKIMDFQKTTLNGQEAYYTIAGNGTNMFKQYTFVKGPRAYVLTYTSEPAKFDKFLNTAESIIKSFKL